MANNRAANEKPVEGFALQEEAFKRLGYRFKSAMESCGSITEVMALLDQYEGQLSAAEYGEFLGYANFRAMMNLLG